MADPERVDISQGRLRVITRDGELMGIIPFTKPNEVVVDFYPVGSNSKSQSLGVGPRPEIDHIDSNNVFSIESIAPCAVAEGD